MQTWNPKPYQFDAIKHLCATPGAGLFLDPGMGKTASTLAAITVLKDADAISSVLVIAPLRPAYKVWPEEIAKWAEFNGLSYVILHGKHKDAELRKDVDVYIINYEGLKWLVGYEDGKGVWHPGAGVPPSVDMLVCDESTKLKSRQAKRTDAVMKLTKQMKRVVILTGTPAPNSYLDLFTQIKLLDGGTRLGRFITHYRRQYFDEYNHGNYSDWSLREGADVEIQDKIRDIVLTLESSDHLEMPELIHNVINVDLPDETYDKYRELENHFMLALDKGDVTVANAAVLSMKLRQIVGGGIYHDNSRTCEEFETNKLDALRDLIEEQQGQPLIVAVQFTHEVERIREALKDLNLGVIPYLGGGMSTKYANAVIDDWNDGRYPVVLCHPTSVAHGLNLQAGGHSVCWYALTWNLEEYIQLNARVYRQGQKSSFVVIHHLVAEGTIDESVLDALKSKNRSQKDLLAALKTRGKRHGR